jgi:hypothetical protein
MYRNKLTYSLTIGLSITVLFHTFIINDLISLCSLLESGLKMAKTLNNKNEQKLTD